MSFSRKAEVQTNACFAWTLDPVHLIHSSEATLSRTSWVAIEICTDVQACESNDKMYLCKSACQRRRLNCTFTYIWRVGAVLDEPNVTQNKNVYSTPSYLSENCQLSTAIVDDYLHSPCEQIHSINFPSANGFEMMFSEGTSTPNPCHQNTRDCWSSPTGRADSRWPDQ